MLSSGKPPESSVPTVTGARQRASRLRPRHRPPESPRLSMYTYVLVAQSCLTLRPRGLQPARLLCPWDSPGKSAGVGCHFPVFVYFSFQYFPHYLSF